MTAQVKFINITGFINTYFEAGQAPARNTIINMIERGEIKGRRMGKVYYIDRDAWEESINTDAAKDLDPLVKMVMNG